MASNYRIRPDGTGTFTTPEWDTQYYWPVGTKVRIALLNDATGVVVKANSTTVNVQMDADGIVRSRVGKSILTRLA